MTILMRVCSVSGVNRQCWAFLVLFLFASSLPLASNGGDPLLKCGSNCLYITAKLFGTAPDSFAEFEQQIGPPGASGYSVAELCDGARSLGLEALPVRTSAEQLTQRSERFACIAHIGTNHFVLLSSIHDRSVAVIDPPLSYTLPLATLNSQWNGTAILISDGPLETEESLVRRVARNRMLLRFAAVAAAATFLLSTLIVVSRWRRRSAGR
jgi:ABC-type bacteriocin/lantibiotic exporter with double-glycine peptidase domain